MSVFVNGGGGGGAVDSVNGQTGAVVIDASDLGMASEQIDLPMDAAVQPGQPVYAKADGHGALATATAVATAAVAGLALSAASSGAAVGVQTGGIFTLPDWSALVGTTALVPGAAYWLGTGTGTLTAAPPSSGALTLVGRAASANALDLDIQPPIRL